MATYFVELCDCKNVFRCRGRSCVGVDRRTGLEEFYGRERRVEQPAAWLFCSSKEQYPAPRNKRSPRKTKERSTIVRRHSYLQLWVTYNKVNEDELSIACPNQLCYRSESEVTVCRLLPRSPERDRAQRRCSNGKNLRRNVRGRRVWGGL